MAPITYIFHGGHEKGVKISHPVMVMNRRWLDRNGRLFEDVFEDLFGLADVAAKAG